MRYFKTGQDKPLLEDKEKIDRLYHRKRNQVIWGVLIGYSFFYTVKVNLSIAKKPMLEAGVLDVDQMGYIGAALLYVYAFGKFANGFLADRANIRKIISIGLLGAAVVNLIFGLVNHFYLFFVLWAINGWFLSMGSAPSVVSICQWYSNNERGTRYGLWAGAHNLGELINYLGTAALVYWLGWRAGFIAPALVCLVVAIILFRVLADRPQTYGLPHVADWRQDYSAGRSSEKSVGKLQLEVLRHPVVWIMCISSALMYMARYAVLSWMPFYLQQTRGYSEKTVGVVMFPYAIAGLCGALFSGFISDRLFNARRNIPALIYALIEIFALILLYLIPPGHFWADMIAMGMFGLGIGGLVVFLAGLIAIDVCSKKAAGAVKGVIGLFSYIGAATQDWISGLLVENTRHIVAGKQTYNFDNAFYFWIGSSVLSMLLALAVWNAKPKE
ncbi:MAG: MFS transporter [Sedimentisphaerales bacterium]|nr:MFS transporter [Sedimentisphaerales bacterium]